MALALANNFKANKTLTSQTGPAFTATSSANQSYADTSGTLKFASANTGVFDHVPSTGVSRGLAFWEARTNLLKHSEDVTTTWTNNGCTITSDAATSPDGNGTADELARVSANDNVRQVVTAATSTNYVLSLFIKNVDATKTRITFWDVTGSANKGRTDIGWSGATASLSASAGVANNPTFEAWPNDWWRVSFQSTSDAVNTDHRFIITPQHSGSGTESVYVWGMQLEAGDFWTPYIKTTTGTVTRTLPTITSSDVSYYNANAGTLYAAVELPAAYGTSGQIFQLDDGTDGDKVGLGRDGADRLKIHSVASGGSNGGSSGGAIVANTTHKVAGAYANNDMVAAVDAIIDAAPDTDVTFPLTDAPTTTRIGVDVAGSAFNGWIQDIEYYDDQKTPGEVTELTGGLLATPATGPQR